MHSELIERLAARGLTLAVAESLTGGLLCAALTEVPGASAVVRGGVVAYATDLKSRLLGVDENLLATAGPVDADTALAMAEGVAQRLGADIGLSTTGVAGPDPQGGKSVGTVFIACSWGNTRKVEELSLAGTRNEIRSLTVHKALGLLASIVS
ncbi:nicotinamide-nucleotide amidase [Aurantimicrobium minutum]|uniref:CinA family protein n=1 Tax=Aurantimicrobium minutum TaxID=708131 RepID=UPI002473F7A1|nr:nicotinamide-nucleotide amidohydrolase family protein [Aurantimicrobium minutum]MDH6533157.1 nicotinamide-nucleotide amidase [Aurantimicrobium minutum]